MSQDASLLVACHQLGTILREYRTRSFAQLVGRAWLGTLSCLMLILLFLGGIFVIGLLGVSVLTGAWERIREEWLGWLYTALILGGDIFLVVAFLLLPLLILLALIIKVRVHSWRIYVCTDGLLIKKGQVKAFRWEQIDALWQEPREHDLLRHGILILWQRPDTCDVFIRGAGGKVVLEPHLWSHFGELYTLLDRQISVRLLPRALNALNAGDSLDFGDIRVNQNGLSLLRRGSEAPATVPWTDIGNLKIKIRRGSRFSAFMNMGDPLAPGPTNHHCVVIEKRDQTRVRWDVSAVTNVSVLLAIKDSLLGKLQGRTDL